MSVPGNFPLAAPKCTVAQVSTDISDISNRVKRLHASITAFPDTGGSVVSAMAIHTIATELGAALSISTTDIQNLAPISKADGTPILNSLQAIKPTVIDALGKMVTKKPALGGLPINIVALAKQDLNILNNSTNAFEAALTNAAPPELKAYAVSMKAELDAAFAKAIAAYANV